jgi:hypothetical protein
MKRLFILFGILLLESSLPALDSSQGSTPITTDNPYFQLRVHRGSNIYFSVTNYGQLGSGARSLYDPDTGYPAPSAEFPAGSGIEHLFLGCIWIGAIVDDPDNPGELDTLVSVGGDGWFYNVYELIPPSAEYQSIWKEQYIGDEEYYALFCDTTVIGVTPHPVDNRPHMPLGLIISQHSLCWSTPGYDEFFIIEYAIENISDRILNDMWFGLYIDGDVFYLNENPYQPDAGAQDDLNGLYEYGDNDIAWIADKDGTPYDGIYTDSSDTGLLGMSLLHSSTPGLQTNFNWWISNVDAQYDWGPQHQANYDIWGDFPQGGKGTPTSDVAKYQVMANVECDYDQAYSALDWTDDGWIENNFFNPENLADGFETRYLLSFGPLNLDIGEIETLTFAYAGGNNFHTDPLNYETNLRFHTDDSLYINQYYQNLDFSDLLAKVDSASHYYQIGLQNIPIGHPSDFSISDWDSNRVTLRWQPRAHPLLYEYRIYRGTEPGIYDSLEITPAAFTDSVFLDSSVEDNTFYCYVIASANIHGIEGERSAEINVNTGQPSIPTGLIAEQGNSEVLLSWNHNPEPDIAGYIIYRCRFEIDIVDTLIFDEMTDTVLTNSYRDGGLVNGARYWYKIKAYDTYSIESFFTEPVYQIPMGFDSGILFIHGTIDNPQYNPDFDSMVVFYLDLLENCPYQYVYTANGPTTIQDLAPYPVVWWCNDIVIAGNHFCHGYLGLFEGYLCAGGKLIVSGIRNIATINNDTAYFRNIEFQHDYLNLSAFATPSFRTSEFIGAESNSPSFPAFEVDSVKAERLNMPGDPESEGRLFGVGALVPRDTSEVIYKYNAVNPDTSDFHGRPVGIIHHGENYSTAVLEFPLYYIDDEQLAFQIFNRILHEFGMVGIDDDPQVSLPEKTALFQNYPNPFNANTIIKYELAEPANVRIDIYNILGQKMTTLVDDFCQAGRHSIIWHAGNLPSGIYFARLAHKEKAENIKMLLLK